MSHSLARTCAFVFIASLPALAQNGPWTQVCNLNTSGNWETWGYTTGDTDISADGRFVVFVSAWYLDPADPGWADVYMRDLLAGTTVAVSRGQGGVWGNYDSISPSISATGRYVAFQSAASNLTPNGGGGSSIYLRDVVAGTTVRCSIGAGGVLPNDICIEPDISSDGRYVSFVSPATNLLPNPNAYRQVFVWDRLSGNLKMASCDAAGVPGVGHCYFWRSRLSGDGRYCVFDTFASFSALDTNNTVDIYRKDLVTGQIALVSADPSTGIASPGAYSYTPSISADGRYVSFATGSVFAANDTNGVGASDVYVRDMNSNAMMLMSVGMSGFAETSGYSEISADGRHVAFASSSNNIVPNDNNSTTDLFVRDWQLGQTTREMVSYSGGDPNHGMAACAIAANGRRLAFTAYASNIVAGDPNSTNVDCYARDRGPSPLPVTYCIAKVNSQGCTPAIGFSGVPSASGANSFHITAANIVNQKVGTLFYSVTGPSQIPFQGGWLCVQSPRRVPGLVFSAGNVPGPDCSGAFDRDFNAHIMSGVDPALVPGQEFWAQFWSRDPADPTTTNVTDALDAVVGP